MFGKNKKTVGDASRTEGQQSRRSIVRSAVLAFIALVVAVAATVAWYAANREVSGTGMQTKLKKNDPSLFVCEGATVDLDIAEEDILNDAGFSGNLSPISTTDLNNWYYVATWDDDSQATAFLKANLQQDTTTGQTDRYNYITDIDKSTTYTAYNTATYTIFTDYDTLDVYFHPDAITLTGEDAKQLKNALRIGLRFTDEESGNLIKELIYAPVPEAGSGNTGGSTTAGIYYGINGDDSVVALSSVLDDLSTYTVFSKESLLGEEFDATGKTKLFTASTTGCKLQIFVWIEGTDAQAMVGQSDSTKSLKLTIQFAGLVPEETE